MKKQEKGRPVDITGINVKELEKWINSDINRKKAIRCQALISLTKEVKVKDVCNVLGITRETVAEWRRRLKEEGIAYLDDKKLKLGRKSGLSEEIKNSLKEVILKPPKESGYHQAVWDGKLVCKYLKERFNIKRSVRTAQYWLKEIGFTRQRPRMVFKKASNNQKRVFKSVIKKTSGKTQ